MPTILSANFQSALGKLTNEERKQTELTAFQLMSDPNRPGLQFHRIDKSRDPNFWSIRVNRDLRIIVHKTGDSIMLAHVDHHDDAYTWAERRVIDEHPTTGAIQIREVRELVEEIVVRTPIQGTVPLEPASPFLEKLAAPIFNQLSDDELLSVGVPLDWLGDVRRADEDGFLALAQHLPQEAQEGLLNYAATGVLTPSAAPVANAIEHPDSLRRFRVLEGLDELKAALDAPFERWAVFLHPSQRGVVQHTYNGPARVAGSAGTGKTVVALHRVYRVLQGDPDAKVLLTTFSEPLARNLARKIRLLCGQASSLPDRVVIQSFEQIARDLLSLATGREPRFADTEQVRSILEKAAEEASIFEATPQFLNSEWTHVIDPWQIDSAEAYAQVPRMGRKNRLGPKQRERLWTVFAAVRQRLASMGLMTRAGVFAAVTSHYANRSEKPFTHIVVDEAQDLGVAELRFLAAIAKDEPDAMFFAGDLGQRIFQQPFSWKKLGIDVRGRSTTLKVNYRTSHQIRRAADRLLPDRMRDVDENENVRTGTVSVFEGPDPIVIIEKDETAEIASAANSMKQALAGGFAANEIGIFVRSEAHLDRAFAAAEAAGIPVRTFVGEEKSPTETALLGIMHLAKGLEFRLVVLMACDEDALPLAERIADVADDFELDEVLATERQLLYVAATRARDRLIVTAVAPGSQYIDDLIWRTV